MKYAVSVKCKDSPPQGWVEDLAQIRGLTLQGTGKRGKVIIEVDAQALTSARNMLSHCCIFEPLIMHEPSPD